MKFRKKPVVIEAVQYTGTDESYAAVCAFAPGVHFEPCGDRKFHVPTLEGPHIASPGDWIIRGVKGELYPCKPDIFSATYDAAGAISPAPVISARGVIDRLLREADVTPGQNPAISCGVVLRNGIQFEGALSWESHDVLRMMFPAPSEQQQQLRTGGLQMAEVFFSCEDVMAVAVRREVTVTKPSIIARG